MELVRRYELVRRRKQSSELSADRSPDVPYNVYVGADVEVYTVDTPCVVGEPIEVDDDDEEVYPQGIRTIIRRKVPTRGLLQEEISIVINTSRSAHRPCATEPFA